MNRPAFSNEIAPRGLSREEAARYAGCRTLSSFHDRIRRGLLPGPIPGTHTWDRKTIDIYMDKAQGLTNHSATPELDSWLGKRARAS